MLSSLSEHTPRVSQFLRSSPRLYCAVVAAVGLLAITRLVGAPCEGFQTRPDVLASLVAIALGVVLLLYAALGDADTNRVAASLGGAALGATFVGTLPVLGIGALLTCLRVPRSESLRIATLAGVAVLILASYGVPLLLQRGMTPIQFTCP